MKPREILGELDRLGVVLWWQDLGNEARLPTLRFDAGKVPPELAEQICLRTEELHRVVRWEPAQQGRCRRAPEEAAAARRRAGGRGVRRGIPTSGGFRSTGEAAPLFGPGLTAGTKDTERDEGRGHVHDEHKDLVSDAARKFIVVARPAAAVVGPFPGPGPEPWWWRRCSGFSRGLYVLAAEHAAKASALLGAGNRGEGAR